MKLAFVAIVLSSISLSAQVSPYSATVGVPESTQLLKNAKLTAYSEQVSRDHSGLWKEMRDSLSVTVGGAGKETLVVRRSPNRSATSKLTSELAPGSVNLYPAGASVRIQNTGKDSLKMVRLQFSGPVGPVEPPRHSQSHYCNDEDPRACVTEKYLFCTRKFCAEEVTMAPGARSTRHSHDTEHMLIAITDYSLADDVSGKGIVHRAVKSGGVEYLPAGITHVLTNTARSEVRLIAIIFR